MTDNIDLIIVGGRGGTNIGDSFSRSAGKIGIVSLLLDIKQAFSGPRLLRYVSWYMLGRKPLGVSSFSARVVRECWQKRPKWLLVTGIAPLNKKALIEIGALEIPRINYLTDDPWNKAHFSRWFLETLTHYDVIYSTRRANIEDLLGCGCKRVKYLPFGYDEILFYPEPLTEEDRQRYSCDIIFVGGADKDRIRYMDAIIRSGIKLALYGSYWQKYHETMPYALGQIGTDNVRKATCAAKIALCLARRANRDGHSMRSFEIPAMAACLLAEDTKEHRQIFGKEGEAAVYFDSPKSMIGKARWLLEHDKERARIAQSGYQLITRSPNTYKDRLRDILGV